MKEAAHATFSLSIFSLLSYLHTRRVGLSRHDARVGIKRDDAGFVLGVVTDMFL